MSKPLPSASASRAVSPPSTGDSVVDYEALDPGIRAAVRQLRAERFATIDSGDGVSKEKAQRVFHVPHVVCVATPSTLVSEANRLQSVLGAEWRIEGSYCPSEQSTLLLATRGAVEPQGCDATCSTCVHLRPFELAPDLNVCPVVNIRIHTESASVFGCNQHEPKASLPSAADVCGILSASRAVSGEPTKD